MQVPEKLSILGEEIHPPIFRGPGYNDPIYNNDTSVEVLQHSKTTKGVFKTILSAISKGEDFNDGISFLDLKNEALISYMIEVCNLILNKVRKKSIENNPSVERSIELRLILEKIRTIDQRLSYQINKLISTQSTSHAPTDHRVNIDNIEVDGEEESEQDNEDVSDGANKDQSDEEAEGKDDCVPSDDSADIKPKLPKGQPSEPVQKSTRAYRPPKLRSMVCEVDDLEGDEGSIRKKRKRNLNKILMEDLQREMDDMPIEINDRIEKVDTERLQYEEDNFQRLQSPSKKKKKKYRVGRGGRMGGKSQNMRI